MNNLKFLLIAVLCFLAISAFSQTFETIDRIDWSTQTGLDGTTSTGITWDATGNENNDCDGDGFFGIQNDAFVINAWEGSCGCPCGPNDPSTNCGQNDSEIELRVPPGLLTAYCSVRVQIPIQSSGTLECGTNDDMTSDDIDLGGCLEPGTDFMEIVFTVFNGDGSTEMRPIEVCGDFNAVIEETFDDAAFVDVTIRVGNQEVDEFYELGDIEILGVERDLASLTIFPANHDNGFICENSSRPLILNTNIIAPDEFDFVWSGPNNFISTDAEVRFNPGDLDPSRQGLYTLQLTDSNGCMLEESIDIFILPATNSTCTSTPEFSFITIQCSDVDLPLVSDNGIPGTWSPSADLDQFAGQTVEFTFIPDDPAVSTVEIVLEVDDVSRLNLSLIHI